MDARIRYLAIGSEQPDRLAHFYTTYFGMRELGRSGSGAVALTDGFYNLSLAPPGDGMEAGLSRIGIQVDAIADVAARLAECAPHVELRPEPDDLFHGECRLTDPNGLEVSLSTRQFGVPDQTRGLPAIRHVAVSVPNNQEVLDFYMQVFGFREPSTSKKMRAAKAQARFAADGATSIAILPYPVDQDVQAPEGGWAARHFKANLNHFGFLVSDIEQFLQRLPPGSISRRPSIRPMTEYRAVDPEANEIDISQHKGYEIDVDTWASA